MIVLTVEAHGYGDGWLSVDTADWISDRGDYDDHLTTELRGWLDGGGHRWPHSDLIARWAEQHSGQPSTGLYGEGRFWSLATYNTDNLLSEDLAFVVLATADLGELMVTQCGNGGIYTEPEVYRSTVDDTTDWADYSRAHGRCAHGHHWLTDDARRLHPDHTWQGAYPTISRQARMPFGDPRRAYIACPDCGKALHFAL